MFLAGKLNSAFGRDLCLAIKHCFCNAVMFPCTCEWENRILFKLYPHTPASLEYGVIADQWLFWDLWI